MQLIGLKRDYEVQFVGGPFAHGRTIGQALIVTQKGGSMFKTPTSLPPMTPPTTPGAYSPFKP